MLQTPHKREWLSWNKWDMGFRIIRLRYTYI
jgi:hypothetical protein